jgi:hypothetical protein
MKNELLHYLLSGGVGMCLGIGTRLWIKQRYQPPVGPLQSIPFRWFIAAVVLGVINSVIPL